LPSSSRSRSRRWRRGARIRAYPLRAFAG
jgi:hypothetical protein